MFTNPPALIARNALWLSCFAAALAMPGFASAQSAFGRPVLKRSESTSNMLVVRSGGGNGAPVLVPQVPAVTKTQRLLAEITASQASGAQVVTLPYQQHGTYDIPIRTGMFTTISIPTSEPIQQFAVSNPAAVQLQVNAPTNTAMVKLIQPITVVATIVTNAHIFYLNIVPAADGDPWYQGVNWSFGTESFGGSTFDSGLYTNTSASAPAGAAALPASGVDPTSDLFTGQPNFNYQVSGSAPFRPQAVWDNGRFTWIQFPKNIQELPALFVDGPNGLEIVNYTVHADGTQLLVNRLMPAFVLKLGKSEIHVRAAR